MAWGWRGRGRGWGGGGWAGPWPGRGPFSYLPPWQRPGWLFGFGRGFGRGWWGGGNPYVCGRFPWLPRWWWARPGYGYGLPFTAYGGGAYGFTGYGYPYSAYPSYPTYGYGLPYMGYW